MNKKLVLGLAVVVFVAIGAVVGWIVTGDSPRQRADSTPSPTVTTTARPTSAAAKATAPVQKAGPIVPGGLLPVRVGMTVQDAGATGFVAKDEQRSSACGVTMYTWVGAIGAGTDVVVVKGTVDLLATANAGLKTAEGIGVGSTAGQIAAAYGNRAHEEEIRTSGRSAVFIQEGDKWIGFLFDEQFGALPVTAKVTYIEVTAGRKPLQRVDQDGC